MNKHKRTGRTTRMLEEAKRLDELGRAVYVVANNSSQADALEKQYLSKYNELSGVKFETPASLSNLDWATMTLRGAHPNCKVLMDHHCIESRLSAILEMLHAFDLKD